MTEMEWILFTLAIVMFVTLLAMVYYAWWLWARLVCQRKEIESLIAQRAELESRLRVYELLN